MLAGEAIAGNPSTAKGKRETPLFRHRIETRNLFELRYFRTNPLIQDKEILKIPRNQFSHSFAAAIFIGHSEDLLTQILLCLPPKSVLRFQCVSKQWRFIISSSDFPRFHCQKFRTCCSSTNASALFLFRRKSSELNFISFFGEDVKPMSSITSRLSRFLSGQILGLHTSNGLLLIDYLNYDQREFIVSNPTTGHFRLIPKCKIAEERIQLILIVLWIPLPLKSILDYLLDIPISTGFLCCSWLCCSFSGYSESDS